MLHQLHRAAKSHQLAEKREHNMYTTVDMRALQDRLDGITAKVAEAQAVEAVEPEAAPEVETAELSNGDAELAELKDMLGRSGVMGMIH